MNRWILWVCCAWLFRSMGADESLTPVLAPDKVVARLAPSLVRVEYHLQFDKGDAPVGLIGDEQRSERGRSSFLAMLVEEERPAETSGFLVARDEVVTFTPDLHPRFIKSIQVRYQGEVVAARVVSHARDTWGVKLKLEKPLASATPLVFSDKPGKPRQLVHYYRNNGLWGVHLGGYPSDTMSFDSGKSIRPLESVGLVTGAAGEALGIALDNLPLDDSWQGSPSRWNWLTEEQLDERLVGLKKTLDQSVLHVRLSFRSPKGAPGRQRMRMDREDEEGGEGTERDVLGVVLPGNRLLVLEDLKPQTTARLERIMAMVGGKAVGATFEASLKDFGVFVAKGESSLGPAAPIADGALAKHLDVLMLRADVFLQGEKRTDYLRAGRIAGMKLGAKGIQYPEFLDTGFRDAWLFTIDRQLVAMPVEKREPVTARRDQGSRDRARTRSTHAVVLANAVAALPEGADPANVPVSEADENRLAWLGVELQPLGRDLARANGVADQTRDGEAGALITFVHPDSPAGRAQIAAGSVLLRLRVPGQPLPVEVRLEEDQMRSGPFPWERLDQIGEQFFDRIPTPWAPAENSFTRSLTDLGFGTRFTAEFFVDGKLVSHEFEVVASPTHYESAPRFKSEALGLTVRDLTYDVRRYVQRGTEEPGVVVSKVEPGGKASVAGVKPYELITHINEQPVQTIADFEKHAATGGELKLSIKRMAKGRIVTVKSGGK
jgi:hypothetical protein